MGNNRNDSIIGYVCSTNEYTKFKKLEGNRSVVESRKRKISKSVKEHGQLFSPIIVNEKMEIIDGQGRFEVFSEFGLPIFYVMREGLTKEHCAILNSASTGWSMQDFIDSYISQGNEDYVRLNKLIVAHPLAPLSTVVYAITGASGANSKNIKEGKFTAEIDAYKKAHELLLYAEKFLPDFSSGNKANFMNAVIFCMQVEKTDKKKLLDKWIKYGKTKTVITAARTIKESVEMLENAYNYKVLADSAIYFVAEYDKYCRRQSAGYFSKWGEERKK